MKILVVASTFPAHENDQAPAFVRDEVIHMKKQRSDFEFHVLAPHFSNETKPLSENEFFTEHRFHYYWPAKYQKLAGRGIVPAIESNKWYYFQVPFLFLFEFIALLRTVNKINPDIIYAHWFTPQGVIAAIVSSITKTPWVLTSHASDVEIWRKIPFGGAVVRHFLPKAERITVVSRRTLERMKFFFSSAQWNEVSSNVEIIPMGVDTSKFSAPRKAPSALKKEYGLEGKTVILFIGRLARIKGIDYLIKAFKKSAESNEQLRLVVAGDGTIKPSLEKLARDQEVEDKIVFTGYLSGTPKEDYFHLSDMVAVTSITAEDGSREGFPVVIMEALASGKVCISTDASGADVIIKDGVNGYIVPEKNVDALANAIERVSSLKTDELKQMQSQAVKSSQSLDWKHIAEAHLDFLFKEKE